MNAPTAVIAEDEAPVRAELSNMLEQLWPQLRVVAECSDGRQAIDALERHRPDVAFLDIRMPVADGLQVARSIEGNTHVVFITAFDQFAVNAFEAGAVDYLLKPVDRERLRLAVDRVAARLASGRAPDVSALLDQLGERLGTRSERIKWITASIGGLVRMIAVDEVTYFQSDGKYTRVVTSADEAYIRMPLRELLPKLDPSAFWQIHRGTIVRVGAVRAAKRDEDGKLHVTLIGRPETLAVSSSFAAQFRGL